MEYDTCSFFKKCESYFSDTSVFMQSYKQGICASTFHCREFASKGHRKVRLLDQLLCFRYTLLSLPTGSVTGSSLDYVAKKKSSGTDSEEENMSKKDLALHPTIDQITSAFGKGAIMWPGRSQGHRDVPVVSTGSLDLDMALGTGGLPKVSIW
jgi:recombination protein RecA